MLTGWLLVGRNPFGTNPFGAGLKGCCDLRFELVLPGFGVVGCGEFTFFLFLSISAHTFFLLIVVTMGKTYSNAFRFASVNADMVAGGLVLVAVFRIDVEFGVQKCCVPISSTNYM